MTTTSFETDDVTSPLRRLVLKAELLDRLDVFRLKDFPVAEFVSERFVHILEEHNLTGYKFIKCNLSADSEA